MLRKSTHKKKGFTLLEILIAVGIFSLIALFATGSLVVVFGSNRKSNAIQSVMTNLNFAVENMSREIRFGWRYHCGSTGSMTVAQDCYVGRDFISFVFEGDQISYRINGTTIERRVGLGNNWDPYISGDVTVERLRFYVIGADSGDNVQPRVTLVIKGSAGAPGSEGSEFFIQNSLSQRREEI